MYQDWSLISIKLAAAELQLSEKINVRQEETKAYPFTAFLADTGGALGLFLGLSILQIFQWIGSLWPNTIKLLKYTYAQIILIQRVISMRFRSDGISFKLNFSGRKTIQFTSLMGRKPPRFINRPQGSQPRLLYRRIPKLVLQFPR